MGGGFSRVFHIGRETAPSSGGRGAIIFDVIAPVVLPPGGVRVEAQKIRGWRGSIRGASGERSFFSKGQQHGYGKRSKFLTVSIPEECGSRGLGITRRVRKREFT